MGENHGQPPHHHSSARGDGVPASAARSAPGTGAGCLLALVEHQKSKEKKHKSDPVNVYLSLFHHSSRRTQHLFEIIYEEYKCE